MSVRSPSFQVKPCVAPPDSVNRPAILPESLIAQASLIVGPGVLPVKANGSFVFAFQATTPIVSRQAM